MLEGCLAHLLDGLARELPPGGYRHEAVHVEGDLLQSRVYGPPLAVGLHDDDLFEALIGDASVIVKSTSGKFTTGQYNYNTATRKLLFNPDEDLLREAIRLVLDNKKASVSLIQRRLKVGFARAGRLMDMMEERNIVGPYLGSKPREILVDPEEFLARLKESQV